MYRDDVLHAQFLPIFLPTKNICFECNTKTLAALLRPKYIQKRIPVRATYNHSPACAHK